MLRKSFIFISDLLIVTFAFLIMVWIKPATVSILLPQYSWPFLYFLILWGSVSLLLSKYNFKGKRQGYKVIWPVIVSNLLILGLITSYFYYSQSYAYSRSIVFGTVLIATLIESTLALGTDWLRQQNRMGYFYEGENGYSMNNHLHETTYIPPPATTDNLTPFKNLKIAIIEESGIEAWEFMSEQLSKQQGATLALSTTTRFNILNQPNDTYTNIVNLKRINSIQYINKFFEGVNVKIPFGGIFIGCVETYTQRKRRILKKYPAPLNWAIYTTDFILKRVFPKLAITKQIYFFITGGKNRVMSRAETLGRLISCGFKIKEERFINNLLYFSVIKIKEPAFDFHPTYGPLIRLKRIGKDGKTIGVFKMRTMHAYSEYLQQYIFENNHLQEGGKFKDDFRITTVGKFMRKTWIDELPMLINLLKRELKLVGVRPISKHYFSLYSQELKERRMKHRPGLIPPFYADMPNTLNEIQESEMRYLEAYEKNPFLTDFRYFFAAMYNILIKKARSN